MDKLESGWQRNTNIYVTKKKYLSIYIYLSIYLYIYFCCLLHDLWHVAKCESNKMQGNFCRCRPLYQSSIMFCCLHYGCCIEAGNNLPTEEMSRPGGVAAKCHQPSLLGSDINRIRGWWSPTIGGLIVEKWKSIKRLNKSLHIGNGGNFQRCAQSRLRGIHH